MADDVKIKIDVDSKEANKDLDKLNKNLDKTGEEVKDIGKSATGTKKGFGAMKTGIRGVGTAMKAAGIGFLLGLLGSLFGLMKQNQGVMDFINKATKTMAIMFNDLTTAIEPLYDSLVGLFTEPKKALVDFGASIKTYVMDNFKRILDSVGLIGRAFKKLFAGDFKGAMEDGAEGIKELVISTNPLLLATEAVVKGVIKVGEVAGESFSKAADAADKFIEKENELKLASAQLNKTIAENRAELENLKLVRDDETASIEDKIAAGKRINEIIEQESAASINLQKQKIALMKADLDLTNTTLQDKIDIANAEAELSNIVASAATRSRENLKRTNAISKQVNAEKVADGKATAEEIQKNKDDEAAAEKSLQDYLKGLEDATDEAKLEKIEKEKEQLELYYEEKLLSEEAYLLRVKELNDEADAVRGEDTSIQLGFFNEAEQEKVKMVAAGLTLARGLLAAQQSYQNEQMNRELDAAGDNEQKKEQIRKEYGKKKKAAAIIDAIIGTALAVLNGLSTIPFLPMGPIMAGVAGAIGAVQIGIISQQQYAKGGITAGPSHAQGGITTNVGEMEGGEGVINKLSMTNPSLRNMASIANVAGGGDDFSTGDGSVKLSPESIAMMIQGINDKQVYVSENDITETQNRVSVIENESIL
jgi:hypothetical protein